ncbi:MAG TPA: rRNA maturation RNase YbeY [Ignavibacteriales bacterium]|jgi:rRNA maturation RNase YbeY|nr:rRNA maturation RNase YbeY [Ignavibacteriales bacterium]
MIKYLRINNLYKKYKLNKSLVHNLVNEIKNLLDFSIKNIDINFVNNDVIKQINIDYLKHNYTTDIITFNYDGNNKILNSEIFISIDEAKDNAEYFKCSLNDEIVRLIIHGFLHLVGYDDMNDQDYKVMKSKEDELVSIFAPKYKGIISDTR